MRKPDTRSFVSKVDFYRHERMPLPLAYFQDQDLVGQLDGALTRAEEVSGKLRGALSRLATLLIASEADQETGRKPDKKDVSAMVEHWGVMHRYWGTLEPAFLRLMEDLPRQGDAALSAWQDRLRSAARDAFVQAEALAGTGIKAIKAAVQARGQLEGGLRKALVADRTEQE